MINSVDTTKIWNFANYELVSSLERPIEDIVWARIWRQVRDPIDLNTQQDTYISRNWK